MTKIPETVNTEARKAIQEAISLGLNGKSAYELAVMNGFVGSIAEWLQSLVGATGQFDSSVDSIKFPNFELKYNSVEDTLDFVYRRVDNA
jgi:hypothetical protein